MCCFVGTSFAKQETDKIIGNLTNFHHYKMGAKSEEKCSPADFQQFACCCTTSTVPRKLLKFGWGT
jgi:hypothetical protein